LIALTVWMLLRRPDLDREETAQRAERKTTPACVISSSSQAGRILSRRLFVSRVHLSARLCLDIVSPQRLTHMLPNTIPISLDGGGAHGRMDLADDKTDTRRAPRQALDRLVKDLLRHHHANGGFPVDALGKWG
jgi:hypothetical protein